MEQLTLNSQILRSAAQIIRGYCYKQQETLDMYLSNVQALSDQWQDDETFSQMYMNIALMVSQCKDYFNEIVNTYPALFEQKAELIDNRPKYPGTDTGHTTGNNNGQKIIVDNVDYSFAIKKHGKNWVDQLPAEQKSAIRDYTGHYYRNINAALRGLDPFFEEGNDVRCLNVHEALLNAKLPHSCTVYRGTDEKALGKYAKLKDKKLVGKLLFDDAFMSTSLNRADAFKDTVLFEISVSEGANGAYVGSISQAKDYESEVLFDAGQCMRITGVRRDDSGRRIISAVLL